MKLEAKGFLENTVLRVEGHRAWLVCGGISVADWRETLAAKHGKLSQILGRLLCWLGLHDFRVINVRFGFGASGNIEQVECRRCGRFTTRQSR